MPINDVIFGADLLASIFPTLCYACKMPKVKSEKFICTKCQSELPVALWRDPIHNPVASIFSGRLPIAYATSYLLFTKKGMTQNIMHHIKYEQAEDLAFHMGKMMGRAFANKPWMTKVDAIIPVPLHTLKLKKRGFNQAEILAKGIALVGKKQLLSQALVRIRNTETQTKKNRLERIKNLDGAFEAKKLKTPKHVLILDDVTTTGATIEACGNAFLRVNPNCTLSVATLAYAE